MAFVLETGAGLPNSNAFISVQFAKNFWDDRGRDYATYTDEEIEQAIIRATFYISESHRFKGYRKRPRNSQHGFQALEFPRQDLFDQDGYWVDDDKVPREVEWATAVATWQELTSPHSLQPVYESHGRVESEQVGPLKVVYDTTQKTAYSARPVLLEIRDFIGQFLLPSANNMLSGRAVRG